MAGDIAFWLLALEDPAYPIDETARLSIELPAKLQALGIILLLTNADSDGFYFNLIRGGRARLAYLNRALDLNAAGGHHFASGRYGPLLGAIAAGDFDLARAGRRRAAHGARATNTKTTTVTPNCCINSCKTRRRTAIFPLCWTGSKPIKTDNRAHKWRCSASFWPAIKVLSMKLSRRCLTNGRPRLPPTKRGQLEEPVVMAQARCSWKALPCSGLPTAGP